MEGLQRAIAGASSGGQGHKRSRGQRAGCPGGSVAQLVKLRGAMRSLSHSNFLNFDTVTLAE